MSTVVGIIENASGNIASVRHALAALGVDAAAVRTPCDLARCDRAILPGVGSLPRVMQRLAGAHLDDAIKNFAVTGKPFLGICVGMQALATRGEEGGGADGLNLIPGVVTRLTPAPDARLPHIGWNDVTPITASRLFSGAEPFDVYFVHSFAFVPDNERHSTAACAHGAPFVAAVEKDNVMGVQFHPEKSQRAGLALLERFLTAA